MFQNLIKSLSGSFSDLAKWEPSADRSESALRSGLEKVLLFVLCASSVIGLSALLLGVSQQTVFCDRGLAFWNGFLGAIMMLVASACSSALFFDSQPVRLIAKLTWTNCETSLFEYGTPAFTVAAVIAGGPLAALLWIMRGWVDVTSSPTCRNTAALLYGGTLTNIAMTISALCFAALMISYYIASSKRFYDIAILSCICDPVSVVVEGVAASLPEPPRVRLPDCIPVPTFDECVEKLPTHEKIRSLAKRIVETITPVSLPQRVQSLMDTRVY